MAAKNYKAYTLSMNDIKRAKVETGDRAIAIQIVRLILLETGVNSLFPGMGVGIVTLCKGKTEADIDDIKKVIDTQIDTYLPKYKFVNIELSIGDTNHTLVIEMQVNDTVFIYDTAETETPIVLGDLKNN